MKSGSSQRSRVRALGGGVAGFEFLALGLEALPGGQQARPGPADLLIGFLAGQEVVIFGTQIVQLRISSQDALEQIGREQPAFGADGKERGVGVGLHIS